MWPLRKFGILFVPETETRFENGTTRTELTKRSIYLRFLLDDYGATTFGNETLLEPSIIYGVFTSITAKKKVRKLEDILVHFEYNDDIVFSKLPILDFEDAYLRVVGTFVRVSLFSFSNAEAVETQLAEPALALYRTLTDVQSG